MVAIPAMFAYNYWSPPSAITRNSMLCLGICDADEHRLCRQPGTGDEFAMRSGWFRGIHAHNNEIMLRPAGIIDPTWLNPNPPA